MSDKRKIYKLLPTVFTIIFLAIFLVYMMLNIDDFKALKNVSLIDLTIISLLQASAILLNGVFLVVILKAFGKKISVYESWFVSLISSIGNYFTPMRGGAAIRAVYLKKSIGLDYTKFMVTLSGNYIIVFFVNSALGLLAMALLGFESSPEYITTALALMMVMIATLVLIFVGVPGGYRNGKEDRHKIDFLIRKIGDVQDGWNEMVKHKSLMVQMMLLTLLNFLITAILIKASANALGYSISILGLVLFSALDSIALLFSFTPGSIGIKEAIYVFTAGIVALSAPQILSISLLIRGSMFIALFVGWIGTRLFGSPSQLEAKLSAESK
jgi:uncharacterized membrane protein YbhN (UPF0104 family)